MKRLFSLFLLLLIPFLLIGCNGEKPNIDDNDNKDPDINNPDPEPVKVDKYLILDEDGNYGGSIDEEKYGKGAPLNGELDIENSEYYPMTDYYNMPSTEDRTIFTNFAPYQQRMADTGGIASALMILNYFGEDVHNEHNELALLNRYEKVNDTVVYGKGTDAEGIKNLFLDLGYTATAGGFEERGSTTREKIANFNTWIHEQLKRGRFVMVRYQDVMDFDWHVIIGHDTMGTDYGRESALIMADPYDVSDHYQDGYKVSPAGRFYRWWHEVDLAGNATNKFDCVIIEPKVRPFFNRIEDPKEITQTIPERHLILNADGTFGGTRNAELYGVVASPPNGESDKLYSPYYKFVDYYNMEHTSSRLILPKYKAFQQTMSSSCGIASILSVLNYYGEDTDAYDEVYLVEKYQEVNDIPTIVNKGTGSNGLKKLVATMGYEAEAASFSRDRYVDINSKLFPTYEEFVTWVKGHLAKGTPIPVSWRPHGGHWEVIIGIDTMGTDNIYDDVLVLADSSDTWDHYRDGYNTLPATLFFRQWYNGSMTYNQQYVVFDRK